MATENTTPKRLIPLLTFRGFLCVGLILLGPLLGMLLDVPYQTAIVVSGVIFLSLTLLLVIDYAFALAFYKTLQAESNLPAKIFCGSPQKLSIELSSFTLRSNARIDVRPEIPHGVKLKDEIVAKRLRNDVKRSLVSFSYIPLARGALCWPALWIRVRSAFGIYQWQRRVTIGGKNATAVYPDPFAKEPPSNQAFQMLASGSTPFENLAGEGREFDRLRKYAPGDDLRHVDWKRTAKRGKLLVKVYRPETHQRINVVLDCGRRMSTVIDQRLQLDFAADAAAHLSQIASHNDDEVGMLAFHHTVIAKIPCRRGRVQRHVVFETLKDLMPGELESDYRILTRWGLAERRRSLIVLLTSVSSVAGLEAIRQSLLPLTRRHLPLVVTIFDRDLAELSRKSVEGLDDAYVHGAAHVHEEQMLMRLEQLERSGIESIYTDVQNLPTAVRNKYFQLKLSGRL